MTSSSLRIVFAGTPDFAAAHLEALITRGFQVVSAYSQPDRPSGRGKKLAPTPVKTVAEAHGIPVQQPLSLDDPGTFATLQGYRPDVMVVVAYGLLLPPAVLGLPRYGCLNVHTSLLPRWRGAAPIERALMSGDADSGVCIMQMDQGLDTGAVLKRVVTPIQPNDNAATLTQRLQQLGCDALCDVLAQLPTGSLIATPQDPTLATYARKIHKQDAQLDWTRSAGELHNLIRALVPRSPAWCMVGDKRLRLIRTTASTEDSRANPGTVLAVTPVAIRIACGNGVLEVFEVQTEGKPAMSVGSLLNGHPDYFHKGQRL
ncbi:MAG TPA: methionyl-tRNA formyltransferase [Candidatus Acidoferrum sp.]|nr:methionyl-tRNA formyltransferase [Candidatus Acidoferrum sp.]